MTSRQDEWELQRELKAAARAERVAAEGRDLLDPERMCADYDEPATVGTVDDPITPERID